MALTAAQSALVAAIGALPCCPCQSFDYTGPEICPDCGFHIGRERVEKRLMATYREACRVYADARYTDRTPAYNALKSCEHALRTAGLDPLQAFSLRYTA